MPPVSTVLFRHDNAQHIHKSITIDFYMTKNKLQKEQKHWLTKSNKMLKQKHFIAVIAVKLHYSLS